MIITFCNSRKYFENVLRDLWLKESADGLWSIVKRMSLEAFIQKRKNPYNYPETFVDIHRKEMVLVFEIWSDDFAPFQNSKNPSIS